MTNIIKAFSPQCSILKLGLCFFFFPHTKKLKLASTVSVKTEINTCIYSANSYLAC